MPGGPVAELEWFVSYPGSGKVQVRVVQQGRLPKQRDIATVSAITAVSNVTTSPLVCSICVTALVVVQPLICRVSSLV
jgi:hypothetical protein